jgi:hypothetical protein
MRCPESQWKMIGKKHFGSSPKELQLDFFSFYENKDIR